MVQMLTRYLGDHGFVVASAASGDAAIQAFERQPADVVLTDLRMKGLDGLDVLEGIRRLDPEGAVIIMTAFGNVESAVDAVQRGAFHYVTKPFKMALVRGLLERAVRERRTRLENRHLRAAHAERFAADGLVGSSAAIGEVRRLIGQMASSASAVLVLGETGSGKELVARALHAASPLHEGPFIVMNCGALPEAMLESQLFGHVRGAFPGATRARSGLLAEADGGTLLLDEVGDMPLSLQARLLRFLESGEVRAVGTDTAQPLSVRCVAATHRDLQGLVSAGHFREDLFFRLAVLAIPVPPLRARQGDIPALVEHFLAKLGRRGRASATLRFSEGALRVLEGHSWPGNVRELENIVERLSVIFPDREVEVDADAVRESLAGRHALDTFDLLADTPMTLDEVQRRYIAAVIRRAGGSKNKAAAILGVDVSTLYRRERSSRS